MTVKRGCEGGKERGGDTDKTEKMRMLKKESCLFVCVLKGRKEGDELVVWIS